MEDKILYCCYCEYSTEEAQNYGSHMKRHLVKSVKEEDLSEDGMIFKRPFCVNELTNPSAVGLLDRFKVDYDGSLVLAEPNESSRMPVNPKFLQYPMAPPKRPPPKKSSEFKCRSSSLAKSRAKACCSRGRILAKHALFKSNSNLTNPNDNELHKYYPCSFCLEKRSREDEDEDEEEEELKLICNFCLYVTNDEAQLKAHIATHESRAGEEGSYPCELCNFKGLHSIDLYSHNKVKHGFFFCDICEVHFEEESLYKLHTDTHSRKKKFSCSRCSKKFATRQFLHIHMTNDHFRKKEIS